MKKDHKITIGEYLRELSDEELLFLTTKLSESNQRDLPDALNFLSKNENVDTVLASARSADALFDMCDKIRDLVLRECRSKGINAKRHVSVA